MKGFIIYPEKVAKNQTNAFDWFKSEATKMGIELEILFSEKFRLLSHIDNTLLYENQKIELPDFVIIRDYNALLSLQFELLGVRVVNTTLSMELSKNKMLTHQVLVKNGIKTPKTIYDINQEYSYSELTSFFNSNQFVVKSLEGAKGENVYLVKNENDLKSVLGNTSQHVIAQEFIENSRGKDIRAWVVGDKVVASVLRQSVDDFRSNVSLGGSATYYELDKQAQKLAVDSVKALNLEFAGIDLLFTDNGFTVCEINGNAGFRSLTMCRSDVNIIAELLKYIKNS